MPYRTEHDRRNATENNVRVLRGENTMREALRDLIRREGIDVGLVSPLMVEIDPLLPVRVFIEALASAGLTIYRNPYDQSLLITTDARAREIGEAVRQSEDARHRMLDNSID